MLRGKTALVTGSIAGLGFAIAEALAQQQANIILHGLESLTQVRNACEQLRTSYGVSVMYSQADLTKVTEIEHLISQANETFGGVYILVNNAVIRHVAAIDDLATASWDESIAVNLSAAFHTSRLKYPT